MATVPVARDKDGNVVLIKARNAWPFSLRFRAFLGRSDQRPLKDLRMKVSSASTIPLKPRGLSLAGARRNRCRQRKAVVGWTPHSAAVFARLSPSIIARACSSHFSFLRRCAIGVLVSALKVRPQAIAAKPQKPIRAAPADDLAARAMGTALSRDALDAGPFPARPLWRLRLSCPSSQTLPARRQLRSPSQAPPSPPTRCPSLIPEIADSHSRANLSLHRIATSIRVHP